MCRGAMHITSIPLLKRLILIFGYGELSHQYVAGPYNIRVFVTEYYGIFFRQDNLVIYQRKENEHRIFLAANILERLAI